MEPRPRPDHPERRTGRLAVALLAVALPLAAAAGCYWWRYHDLMATHVELMEGLAADASAALATGPGTLQPADIERLRYPLQRARQFADIVRGRNEGRESLARFDSLVEAYAALVTALDRARTRSPESVGPRDGEALGRLARVVGERAAAVREAIERERD